MLRPRQWLRISTFDVSSSSSSSTHSSNTHSSSAPPPPPIRAISMSRCPKGLRHLHQTRGNTISLIDLNRVHSFTVVAKPPLCFFGLLLHMSSSKALAPIDSWTACLALGDGLSQAASSRLCLPQCTSLAREGLSHVDRWSAELEELNSFIVASSLKVRTACYHE